ncbi:MAG: hypothetical protein HYV04_17685 [Deltaproteobacteria bacterium]|nr:hypothetical protein [Deltaproteobacteria bacterium]
MRKRVPLPLVVFILVAITIGSVGAASPAQRSFTDPGPPAGIVRGDRRAEIVHILSALQSKLENHRLPLKAREKLSTLSDDRLDLIASLAERMVRSRRALARDIAFLLVASLLILS